MLDNSEARNLLTKHILKDYPKNDHNWYSKDGHICCACGYLYDNNLREFFPKDK